MTDSGWTMVVAVSQNGIIGSQGELPWRIRSDLQRFKTMTMGHCLLMGRKTFESIGRPLPGRQTIVLSRSGFDCDFADVSVVDNIEDVTKTVEPHRSVMVVGGSQVYAAALGKCNTIWLTRVLKDCDGDTLFPNIDWDCWHLQSQEHVQAEKGDEADTCFQIWRRIP